MLGRAHADKSGGLQQDLLLLLSCFTAFEPQFTHIQNKIPSNIPNRDPKTTLNNNLCGTAL